MGFFWVFLYFFCFSSLWLVFEITVSLALKYSFLLHFQIRMSSQRATMLSCLRTKFDLEGEKICTLILHFYTVNSIYTRQKKKKATTLLLFVVTKTRKMLRFREW